MSDSQSSVIFLYNALGSSEKKPDGGPQCGTNHVSSQSSAVFLYNALGSSEKKPDGGKQCATNHVSSQSSAIFLYNALGSLEKKPDGGPQCGNSVMCANSVANDSLQILTDTSLKDLSSIQFRSYPDLYIQSLEKEFTLVFQPFGAFGPTVLNAQGLRRLNDFENPNFIEHGIDYKLVETGLISPCSDLLNIPKSDSTALTAWLHITNACNLECTYCFVEKSNSHMSEETGMRAIQSTFEIAQREGLRAVFFKYAGGEPTLNFKLIQKLHQYSQDLALKTGIDLHALIISNGFSLTLDMANWMVAANLDLSISIDGIDEANDQQRPTKSGKGSFSQIERNVDQVLLPNGVYPSIAITITAKNSSKISAIVEWAIKRDLSFNLNFYRENNLSSQYEDYKLEETEIIEGMLNAYRVIEHYLPKRPFLDGLLDFVKFQGHKHTCSVGSGYLVFTHDGRVAQCPVHLQSAKNFNQLHEAMAVIQNGAIPVISVDEKEGCKECSWRYSCAGGCPEFTYRATGRYDVKSPHCNIYKALIPEALRLEGLRLMKVAGYL